MTFIDLLHAAIHGSAPGTAGAAPYRRTNASLAPSASPAPIYGLALGQAHQRSTVVPLTQAVTVNTDTIRRLRMTPSHERQRTSGSDASQVRNAPRLAARTETWLRDEEANASTASPARRAWPIRARPSPCLLWGGGDGRSGVCGRWRKDDEGRAKGRQIGSKRLIMPDTCPGQPAELRLACSVRGSSVP